MRTFRLITLISSVVISLLILSSCNDKQNDATLGTSILDTMSNDKLLNGGTRTYNESKEEKISFTIIHSGDLAQMTAANTTSSFKALLDSHGLTVESSFEIDADNKGVVLIPTSTLTNPIEIGKKISMLDEVLMVEVGGTKSTKGVS